MSGDRSATGAEVDDARAPAAVDEGALGEAVGRAEVVAVDGDGDAAGVAARGTGTPCTRELRPSLPTSRFEPCGARAMVSPWGCSGNSALARSRQVLGSSSTTRV